MSKFKYHEHLGKIANEDVRFLIERDKTYGGSWKESGGRSAWHMLTRKMDRLKEIMKRPIPPKHFDPNDLGVSITKLLHGDKLTIESKDTIAEGVRYLFDCLSAEDIFVTIQDQVSVEDSEEFGVQGGDGTALAEVRDLRRYLLLVESEMMTRGVVKEPKDVV